MFSSAEHETLVCLYWENVKSRHKMCYEELAGLSGHPGCRWMACIQTHWEPFPTALPGTETKYGSSNGEKKCITVNQINKALFTQSPVKEHCKWVVLGRSHSSFIVKLRGLTLKSVAGEWWVFERVWKLLSNWVTSAFLLQLYVMVQKCPHIVFFALTIILVEVWRECMSKLRKSVLNIVGLLCASNLTEIDSTWIYEWQYGKCYGGNKSLSSHELLIP